MDRYVVAGNPVEHSQSPFIHAEFAKATGQALEYGRLLVSLDGFEAAIRAFADGGAKGCNVTVPFKFDAFRLASRATPRAMLAQAANTLRFDAEGWLADNTDGVGLVHDIERNAGVAFEGLRVLLIGAGGAAAGALGPLLAARPAELVIANRTLAKAEALVARHSFEATDSSVVAHDNPIASAQPHSGHETRLHASTLADCGAAFDIVINASASSMQGAVIPVSADVLAPNALALDMMYGPSAAAFVDWANAHGARGRDGLGMLVEQAACAFEFWRGVRPETGAVLQALRARVDASQAAKTRTSTAAAP